MGSRVRGALALEAARGILEGEREVRSGTEPLLGFLVWLLVAMAFGILFSFEASLFSWSAPTVALGANGGTWVGPLARMRK